MKEDFMPTRFGANVNSVSGPERISQFEMRGDAARRRLCSFRALSSDEATSTTVKMSQLSSLRRTRGKKFISLHCNDLFIICLIYSSRVL
jgi:hypothetical protein